MQLVLCVYQHCGLAGSPWRKNYIRYSYIRTDPILFKSASLGSTYGKSTNSGCVPGTITVAKVFHKCLPVNQISGHNLSYAES